MPFLTQHYYAIIWYILSGIMAITGIEEFINTGYKPRVLFESEVYSVVIYTSKPAPLTRQFLFDVYLSFCSVTGCH
jgi:hypothetical protein